MNKYRIISDGSCDLDDEFVKSKNLIVVPFYITFGQENFKEKEKISVPDFYLKMINSDIFPKTSCPSIDDYYKVFEKCILNKEDVICLCITKKFSGSFNSASSAKNLILEEYPNAKITVVDTIVNTVLQGLVVRQAIDMQENGYSYDEVLSKIEFIKETGRIFFTVNGLSYLQNGGRIGRVSAVIGNVLRINPLIILKEGEIHSSGIAISRNRAVAKVRDIAKQYVLKSGLDKHDFMYCIGYGYDIDEALNFKKKLADALEISESDIIINQIGSTISVHTGPYPLGVGIIKKYIR